MANETKIEWADSTWSPWRGCEHAQLPDGTTHPGCDHCYAEAMSVRNPNVLGVWGPDGFRAIGTDAYWNQAMRWQKQAAATGVRRRVFPSLMDPFEDREELIPLRRRMMEIIDRCPNIDFILLTKRPQNIDQFIGSGGYRHNVWLVTSVSDQKTADALIPPLLGCRGLSPVLGISAEPLLGPVTLRMDVLFKQVERTGQVCRQFDWVIAGGESGHGARPMHPDWARSLRNQCQAAGVPFFFKQWGENLPFTEATTTEQREAFSRATIAGRQSYFGARVVQGPQGLMTAGTDGISPISYAPIGKALAGRQIDGRTWDEFPQVTEVPA